LEPYKNQSEQVFNGVIGAAGRDHIILSGPETGKQFLLLMVYLNYVVFNEEIITILHLKVARAYLPP
jgi:spore germination protein Q